MRSLQGLFAPTAKPLAPQRKTRNRRNGHHPFPLFPALSTRAVSSPWIARSRRGFPSDPSIDSQSTALRSAPLHRGAGSVARLRPSLTSRSEQVGLGVELGVREPKFGPSERCSTASPRRRTAGLEDPRGRVDAALHRGFRTGRPSGPDLRREEMP